MSFTLRLKPAPVALFAFALAIPLLTNGCSSVPGIPDSNPLCCSEFAVGATIGAEIGGSAQSQIAVQAIADIGGIASSAVADLTTSCRGIAQDLSAPKADQDAAEGTADANAKLKAWCALAVKTIGTVKGQAGGMLTVDAKPPACSASISAKANCQAKCDASVKCDIKATPPTCMGGTLSIDCKGGCTAMGSASVACTGKCDAMCSGACDASADPGGVACEGKCEGTCEAMGMAGKSGVQADGTCKGTCKGKCTFKDPSFKVACKGSCDGKCEGKCSGTATASVKCDGKCDADYEPLSCTGGKLEGGCKAEGKCDANCNASVQAKAECTPPSVTISFTGSASAEGAAKLRASLEAHLPLVFAFKAKLTALGEVTGSLSANITAVTDIKVACLPPLAAATAAALTDLADSASAAGSITASIGK